MLSEAEQNQLAKYIQKGFPVDPEPFAVLAKELSMLESDILDQLREWKSQALLREISAVMEGSLLGYESALVCGRVPEAEIERVAGIISEHPTVTHSYKRRYDYNLWFTIAVPEAMGIDKSLLVLENLTEVPRFYPLRRTLTFKVGVTFDLITKTNETERIKLSQTSQTIELNDRVKQIIRLLQTDLPLCQRPFLALAGGDTRLEEEMLQFLEHNLGQVVRRYVATFRHRNLGVQANGMVVWDIPDAKLADLGHRLAAYPEVSHCYARETFPGFAYNLYSMLHAPNLEKLWDMADKISSELGCNDYLVMDSTVEYKKCRLRYFLPELDYWWENNEKLVLV